MLNTSDAIVLLRQQTPEVIQRFVDVLLADPEMSAAAAGRAIGYSPQQAGVLLRDQRTMKLIAALTQELRHTHKDLRMQAVSMLAQLATYDPADFVDKRTNMVKNIHDIDPAARAAIKKFKYNSDGSVQVEFIDRMSIMKLLFSFFGDLEDTPTAHTGKGARVHFHRPEGANTPQPKKLAKGEP